MAFGRRSLLLSALGIAVAACSRSTTPRRTPPTATLPADFDQWKREALAILSDAQQTLRTFDSFQAFRVSMSPQSSTRLGSELAWDPPTSAAWDEALHVTRGLRGRTDQLFQAVTRVKPDPSPWREERAVADATHDLLDLGDALGAYRNRIDALPPGDASGALALLDSAWSQWDAAAARWGVSRAESISCQT